MSVFAVLTQSANVPDRMTAGTAASGSSSKKKEEDQVN
jgi:hypothetical protein